jgi:hypothetical protein
MSTGIDRSQLEEHSLWQEFKQGSLSVVTFAPCATPHLPLQELWQAFREPPVHLK